MFRIRLATPLYLIQTENTIQKQSNTSMKTCLFGISQLGLPYQDQGGIESLHDDFNNLDLVCLSKSSIVKKIAEFGFVVDGVTSRLEFLAIIQRLQEAGPLPIGNIIIFSKRNLA